MTVKAETEDTGERQGAGLSNREVTQVLIDRTALVDNSDGSASHGMSGNRIRGGASRPALSGLASVRRAEAG